MKRTELIGVLLLSGMLLLIGCDRRARCLVDKGVSRELAKERRQVISDLRYTVDFQIPAVKSEPVNGTVKIEFSLNNSCRVVLDFMADSSAVKSVVVNEQEIEFCFHNEHIVIPESAVVHGGNSVKIEFIAGDLSLNRNDDFMYTLLVPDRARTLFPCFDQPDLKGHFTLQLDIPTGWEAVGNSPVKQEWLTETGKHVLFAESEPLSTYLFAFVTGKLMKETETRGGRSISLYHRETDTYKVEQCKVIFNQVYSSLEWMENYTGILYPFAKYDLIILPGFQYGGMEHTGATLYSDKRMFLSRVSTKDEELARTKLIAHEIAHLWFGDYVTMAWFDDVWTKEIFANYFACKMVEPHFPEVNHQLNTLKDFFPPSYEIERTAGTNAIRQKLDNLNDAGLLYGGIIYNKAPIVMNMLVKIMGEMEFKNSIREYLTLYAYGNATWEDLVEVFDRHSTTDIKSWSREWINEKGMPTIEVKQEGRKVQVIQNDPLSRGMLWSQDVRLMMIKNRSTEYAYVPLYEKTAEVEADPADFIIPNVDGEAYGYFELDEKTAKFCLENIINFSEPVTRLSVLITLNENMLRGKIRATDFIDGVLNYLSEETNSLIFSTAVGYLKNCYIHHGVNNRIERVLSAICTTYSYPQDFRQTAFRTLLDVFKSQSCCDFVLEVWAKEIPVTGMKVSEEDCMKMAYELALRFPEFYDVIFANQLARIGNPDRRKEFAFIMKALVPQEADRDAFFNSLLLSENRQVEPWTVKALGYLNHPLRQREALKYICPALEELEEIQRTGDIFFPENWLTACLNGHNSQEAHRCVQRFLEENKVYPPLLKNKILQNVYSFSIPDKDIKK